MTILSTRFAVLACLCAALPLAPSVDAAHLHGSHSMKKHTSSAHSPQRTHNPSFYGGPTTVHKHDDQHHAHRTQDHTASELPPLLRRYRVHDHKKIHNHQGQDHHDHTHDKVSRSAFARSRYRREPDTHSRRSSVYVPGEHGNTYIISRAPSRDWGHGYAGADKHPSHAYNRRQVDESNLALGRIDIMGAAQSPTNTQRLASLTVDSTPIDWSSGQSSAKAFPLNASTTNQTQFIMMPTDDSNAGGSLNKHVTLATEVFDAGSAEMVMYCATYDSDPGAASPLLMTPCTGTVQSVSPADDAADPCAVNENDASSPNPHQSQLFSYDPSSGKIEPISATESASDNSTPCVGAKVRRDTGNSTTSGSARASSTSTSTAPTASASQQARNVTLVYVAGALEVPAPSPSSPITATGQAAVFTTTITTTVVATVTASGPSTRTVTPARAAASVSAPSTPSPSTTIPSPSVPVTTTRPSLSPSSTAASAAATLTTRAPANADESLEVEIVGVTPSTTASATSGTATTTTTSHTSVSPTLDAEVVASLVASQMAHRRRAVVIAGASVA